MTTTVTIEIKTIWGSTDHRVAVVTTRRGFCYACTYAVGDDGLSEAKVLEDWKNDRRAFRPYNTSTASYLS